MQPDTLIPGAENSQSWNRYSYAVNNPVNYRDSTGHCFEPASALICLGVVILGAVTIKAGVDSRADVLQHPAELAQEQQSAQQWQDNCMGQCHYSHAVNPTPNAIAGGARPATPYNDQLVEADWNIANGVMAIAGVTLNAVKSLLPKPPRIGVDAVEDLYAISDKANPATVRPGEDSLNWFNNIIGGEENALPHPFSNRPKAPKLYGEIPGADGATAYYRPITGSNPAIEIKNMPRFPKHIKFHFPK